MKTLILLRHAKSSWDFPDLEDFERPLKSRGETDCILMSSHFQEHKVQLEAVYSSPANRAKSTIQLFVKNLSHKPTLLWEEDLYPGYFDTLVEMVESVPNHYDTVMLVGHNPGFTELASFYLHDFEEDIPTCGLVGIQFKTKTWENTGSGKGQLLFFDFPKKWK